MKLAEISGVLGTVFGFVLAAHVIFVRLPLMALRPRPLWWLLGVLLFLSAPVQMVVGGLIMMAKSAWCGVAFGSMTFSWTFGGNLMIRLFRIRKS